MKPFKITLFIMISLFNYKSYSVSVSIDSIRDGINLLTGQIYPSVTPACSEENDLIGHRYSSGEDFILFVQTIAAINCNNTAVELGISHIQNNELVPSTTISDFSTFNLTNEQWCSASPIYLFNNCALELLEGVFVDGIWGDASLLYQVGKFTLREGARFSIGQVPFRNLALEAMGVKTTEQIALEKMETMHSTFLKFNDYFQTNEWLKNIEKLYCFNTNEKFKESYKMFIIKNI